jgi:hypothetical protein
MPCKRNLQCRFVAKPASLAAEAAAALQKAEAGLARQ